jgi:predicted secreted Zn-dependent protease
MHRRALLLGVVLICGSAGAELSEQLDYVGYEVPLRKGQTLHELLNAASPVRANGGIFHAYTQWHVDWHYHYQQAADGRCRIDSVHTQLTATMTLPAPAAAALAQDAAFLAYLAALRRHEQGHYEIGRSAAAAIDAGILALPAQGSCAGLGAAADALANARLDEARSSEQRYDRDTGFGRTQGAWLN